MDNNLFDKIFEKLIEESIPVYEERETNREENKAEEINDIKFSDTHNAKMKKLFKEVKMAEIRKKMLQISKKVAVIVIGIIAVLTVFVGSVEAWRKEVVKFIMKNNPNNYINISFGDPLENEESGDKDSGDQDGLIIEKETGAYIIDGIKFMYVPEGFEFRKEKVIDEKMVYGRMEYYSFFKDELFVYLQIKSLAHDNIKLDVDSEISNTATFSFGDKEVFKIEKEKNRIGYVWYDEEYAYMVFSNIENEKIITKFIENIKILKNI